MATASERHLVSQMFEALKMVRQDTRFFDLLKDARVAVAAITDDPLTATRIAAIHDELSNEEGR